MQHLPRNDFCFSSKATDILVEQRINSFKAPTDHSCDSTVDVRVWRSVAAWNLFYEKHLRQVKTAAAESLIL